MIAGPAALYLVRRHQRKVADEKREARRLQRRQLKEHEEEEPEAESE